MPRSISWSWTAGIARSAREAALPKLKPGGLLLIDNTDWKDPPHVHVPKDWPLVHQSCNVMTETSIWRKPSTP